MQGLGFISRGFLGHQIAALPPATGLNGSAIPYSSREIEGVLLQIPRPFMKIWVRMNKTKKDQRP